MAKNDGEMCGIAGIYSVKPKEELSSIVKKMMEAIAHRGPDDEGLSVHDGVALGHRRLSIIDISPLGHQPMYSDDGKVVVIFNGEIYNYLELKQSLSKFYDFRTQSDTEVIIAAYLHWGEQFVAHLNGMFAIAVYDHALDQLMLYRDRMGEKPLYFYARDKEVLFASEIRSILSSGYVERVLDQDALKEYVMTQTVSFPNTIVKNVQAIMPGSYLKISRMGYEEIRYWDFNREKEKFNSRKEILQKVRDELHRSVEWRMRADVNFGAFLSGGLDSSVIVALMAEISEKTVHTFSIGFEEKQWDESEIAEQVAKKFNTRHTKMVVNGQHFLSEIENAVHALDHPSGDGVNTYVVSKITREHDIKMAMSGLGGDELLGGYPIFDRIYRTRNLRNLLWLPPLPHRWVEKWLALRWNGVQVERISHFLRNENFSDAAMYHSDRVVNGFSSVSQLFHDNIDKGEERKWMDWGKDRLYSSISEAEMKSYMTHVLLRDSDQMSMANALEIRVPFLDHQLIEVVLSLRDEHKVGTHPKQLLIDLFRDSIPSEVYERKKQGFAFPWRNWMLNEINGYCGEGLKELGARTSLNENILQHWWKAFNAGDKYVPWNKIWHLVVLGHWMKNNEING